MGDFFAKFAFKNLVIFTHINCKVQTDNTINANFIYVVRKQKYTAMIWEFQM